MQAQLGFSTHSASQLHAPAFSSQYQPAGQMPAPHRLQVPSSQLGPLGADSVSGAGVALAASSRGVLAR